MAVPNIWAHDPVFAAGPHVLFKNGTEMHLESSFKFDNSNMSPASRSLSVKYGLRQDWTVGLELPWTRQGGEWGGQNSVLSSKFRFWRRDTLGKQESAALLVSTTVGDHAQKDTTMAGFAWGYESLKWYRWANIRHIREKGMDGVSKRRWMADVAIGYRPHILDYWRPDWVWMLELNGELPDRSNEPNQLFLSPGFMWTWRNFAIKAGVQWPIDISSQVQFTNNRHARIELEWHF